ncbi:elongator complex protein 6 [Callorhinchus milii]|uniref:Elongator complex protein 6 n=2 Tax=Callorhinchus milii TaxID=7868 RepID=V9L560_CALMI|nr:elongator complex protein 6 [Callorhinchus milii]|eukprot:gi/632983283/ref/XP_007908570.1/ PREDICTED: elongator complex protein 6 [Callorhinchus milii]
MFSELNNILNNSPEQGECVLLCDSQTDGNFLVHHFLSFYLKGGCKVCFLGLIQSFSHYSLVAQKLGVNLPAARQQGQLVFMEGLRSSLDLLLTHEPEGTATQSESPLQFLSSPGADLRSLYRFVRTSLSPSPGSGWKFPVLIVDDLSVLLSLGVSTTNILSFIHYCRASICSQLQGNVVVLAHDDADSEDEENELLVKSLQHQSHLTLRAEGLVTGYCKDIHGQLKITLRSPLPGRNTTKVFQYKIQDKNVSFFARGTSPAVL